MKKGFVATLVVVFCASAALAEDGLPSRSKLNSLGLGSMQVASDHDGMQVRGKAFAKIIWSWRASAGEKATFDSNTSTFTIDPADFEAHDFNHGSGIVADGRPLNFGAPNGSSFESQVVDHFADAFHQQDITITGDDGTSFNFFEVSSSINRASIFAGNWMDFNSLNGNN